MPEAPYAQAPYAYDGLDRVRAEVLRQALAEEILAKTPGQCLTEPTGYRWRSRSAWA